MSRFRRALATALAAAVLAPVCPAVAVAAAPAPPQPSRPQEEKSVPVRQVPATPWKPPALPATAVAATGPAPEGSASDYKATPLADTGEWKVSANSGGFSWTYPMRVPPVPGGLQPDLTLRYSSGSVDGRVAARNNQPSWVGEGWDVWPGYVARTYKSCYDDIPDQYKRTGDQCWAGDDQVALTVGGRASELVRIDADTWRLADDDGSRVQRLVNPGLGNGDNDGEHWKLTTTDGTQYFYGSRPQADSTWTAPVFGNDPGEPCHNADFARAWCDQAWRWNLDRVVDTDGNEIRYGYRKETNNYGINLAKGKEDYVRGGSPAVAEYGLREGGGPVARVRFEVADRCAPGTDCAQRTPQSYPDVPWDQNCAEATCPRKYAPTFWSSKRLSEVVTEVSKDGKAFTPVDSWKLDHTYLAQGDDPSQGALWLRQIVHTGLAGESPVATPPVTFDAIPLANRVNAGSDGLPPLVKHRLYAIHNETGGVININYLAPECTADALPKQEDNRLRCFPVYWAKDQGQLVRDWFHKYVVGSVVEVDQVGGAPAKVTSYEYPAAGGAWAYQDNPYVPAERRTWSQWRGFERTVVRTGTPGDPGVRRTATEYRFHRGMHGDRAGPAGGTKPAKTTDIAGGTVEDSPGLQGFLREEAVLDGTTGAVVSAKLHDAWRRQTAAHGSRVAYVVRGERTVERTAVAGGFRRSETVTRYDDAGFATSVEDRGDLAVADDDTCTRTWYTRDEARNLLAPVSREQKVRGTCAADPVLPRDAVSDQRTAYDGLAWGTRPTRGNATLTQKAERYEGTTPLYADMSATGYDDHGRVIRTTDALGKVTTTAFEPPAGLPRSSTVTNPLGHTTRTDLRQEWNTPERITDVNGKVTTLAHDALGRLAAVWKPGFQPGDGPAERYRYELRRDGASAVVTETYQPAGNYLTRYELVDGLGRPRQTQAPAWGGGRILTDTRYDSRGLVVKSNPAYYNAGAAGRDLVAAADAEVPSQTVTEYDGAGRTTAEIVKSYGQEQWRTTTSHHGDHTVVTPPRGGTVVETHTDVRGRTTELRQPRPGGTDRTVYRHHANGQLESMTDAAGNTLRYAYDLLGNRIELHDPDKGSSTMTYDRAGRLRTRTDARGTTLTYEHDDLGRKTALKHGDTLLAQWRYDTVPGAKGQLGESIRHTPDGAYTKAVTRYDDGYRPTETVTTIPPSELARDVAGTYRFERKFRPDGSPSYLSLPVYGNLDAEVLQYEYDQFGKVRKIASASGQYLTAMQYTRYGEPAQTQQGPGGARMWQTSYYDVVTRRAQRTIAEREKAGALLADDTTYGYDPAGNVTMIASTSPEGQDTRCFGYDHLRRNTEVWTATDSCRGGPGTAIGGVAPQWTSYTYDAIGNRRTENRHGLGGAADTVRTYAYPEPGQQRPHAVRSVTTAGSSTVEQYGYTPTGATDTQPGPGGAQNLDWDAEDLLVAVTTGDRTTRHVYDAEGNRLVTKDPAGTTLHLPQGQLRYDNAARTKSATRYYRDGDRDLAVRSGGAVHHLVTDLHGTATVAVDAVSLAAQRRRLDSFGEPRQPVPAGFPGGKGFVGGTQDGSSGLTRVGERDYVPGTGRFVSVDPLVNVTDPQSFNGFAYSGNNPATMNDRTGLAYCDVNVCPGDPGYVPGKPRNCYDNGANSPNGCPNGQSQTPGKYSGKGKAPVRPKSKHAPKCQPGSPYCDERPPRPKCGEEYLVCVKDWPKTGPSMLLCGGAWALVAVFYFGGTGCVGVDRNGFGWVTNGKGSAGMGFGAGVSAAAKVSKSSIGEASDGYGVDYNVRGVGGTVGLSGSNLLPSSISVSTGASFKAGITPKGAIDDGTRSGYFYEFRDLSITKKEFLDAWKDVVSCNCD
ncbi:RHS repeat-associated core domain-containing protein [Amycolatopsis suaedae]|uniref:Type IV secretion protein Rhs n=1 Tax=Amycolatopsis suaedae TaxID=2510978 RepID=A0A4Q7J661_9PSEU|nr:RHS repeat-associated core domain-containing protein [Amycolatopsis suaedae]RZQ62296.1 hypothetical protein EWH70_18630 [Amycolatopsis suaedae]